MSPETAGTTDAHGCTRIGSQAAGRDNTAIVPVRPVLKSVLSKQSSDFTRSITSKVKVKRKECDNQNQKGKRNAHY